MRVFIGLSLSNQSKIIINNQVLHFKSIQNTGINWVKANNLHLTLKFIGAIDKNKLDMVIDYLNQYSHKKHQLVAQFKKVIFIPASKPKIIVLQVSSECLLKIMTELDAGLKGICQPSKFFTPHITLGRIKTNLNPDLKNLLQSFNLNSEEKFTTITLFESILSQNGADYRIIKNFNLND